MTSSPWIKWLNEHPSRDVYDKNPEKVVKLVSSLGGGPAKFNTLANNKNIVVLSRAQIGKKLQASFFHSVVGIPITPDELHYVALSGMNVGTGIEFDNGSFLSQTSAQHVPQVLDFMKVTKTEEFENLVPTTTGQKRKINNFAILTPALAECVQKTDMSPAAVFIAIVEQIKAIAPNPTAPTGAANTSSSTPATTDALLKTMGSPYEDVFRFIWAIHHHPTIVSSPKIGNLLDEDTIQWEKEVTKTVLPKQTSATIDLTKNPLTHGVLNQDGAITAITKLSESMVKHQEAVLKNQEDKKDTRIKAWNKLPEIQKNIILLGGVDDQGTVPSQPTEELLSIIGCQNGAQVDQYLKQVMTGHNIQLEPGFCSAINKGIFVHADDATTPKHFTGFLTPPISEEDDRWENKDLLKLAVQTKFNENDVTLLTKMDVTIPMKTQDLKHHVKNIAGLAGRCFGDSSILYQSLQSIADHIEEKEISYNYEFRQESLFGGNFLDRIHWRMHRFFDSCASGNHELIDLDKLDFSDILQQVERREYICKVPHWITRLMKLKEKKTDYKLSGTNKSFGKGRSFDKDNERSKKVSNQNQYAICKLADNESYRSLFHPGNLRGLTKPTYKNGDPICLRCHTLGYCFINCKYASGHGPLNQEEAEGLAKFLEGAREAKKKYLEKKKGQPVNSNEGEKS